MCCESGKRLHAGDRPVPKSIRKPATIKSGSSVPVGNFAIVARRRWIFAAALLRNVFRRRTLERQPPIPRRGGGGCADDRVAHRRVAAENCRRSQFQFTGG